jgi:large subunit ribosomal protein L6
MSRLGVLPVSVPQGVNVAVQGSTVSVEGPKGKLSQQFNEHVEIKITGNEAVVTRKTDAKPAKASHGLYRNLIRNMIEGVTKGYSKTLMITGVGYKAEVKGKILVLNLGFSSQIAYMIEEGLTITCEGPNKIQVFGIDKQKVGKACAEIRSLREPEPYKGKGIRYENEFIKRKVGKTGVK